MGAAVSGNARGAVSLLERGSDGIARWIGDPPAGLDLRAVQDHGWALAARIERAGTAGLTAADLAPRLRRLPRP